MEFLPAEFIRQRKRGEPVSRENIETFINGYVSGEIPEYQVAAWLMAVCFKPLSPQETAWLTEAMANSGRRLKFSSPHGLSVDKHSTGGVGDKTTMILAPIVAAAGVHVPMMAGRGLGHTGGTLDKLEAIHGMNVRWNLNHFQKQVEKIGICIIGQTEEICPADRKMYSLRDVTGTVDSLPLICGSIMSKKIAEGCESLVLDVKFGSGAFMKGLKEAEDLAMALSSIGRASGLKVTALLTNMNEPLGRFVGNALEIQECFEILRREKPSRPGKSWTDTESLSLDLAAHMLFVSQRCASLQEAKQLAIDLLESGKAYEKFVELVKAQGGDLHKPLAKAKNEVVIAAEHDGFVRFVDVEKIGLGCIVLGAGRKVSSDKIDFATGLEVLVTDGQPIKSGDTLFIMHANDHHKISEAEEFFKSSVTISTVPHSPSPLIAKVLS